MRKTLNQGHVMHGVNVSMRMDMLRLRKRIDVTVESGANGRHAMNANVTLNIVIRTRRYVLERNSIYNLKITSTIVNETTYLIFNYTIPEKYSE